MSRHQPAAPRSRNPAIPVELERLIQSLLARNPADRPQTARDVIAAIEAIERARKPSMTRRWLIASSLILLAGIAASAWAALTWFAPVPEPPPEPALVTIDSPRAEGKLYLRRGDDPEIAHDPAAPQKLTLPPGEYALRPEKADEHRRLVPARLILQPGEQRRLVVRHIGRLDLHRTHAPWPVPGLVVQATLDGPRVVSLGVDGDRRLAAWSPLAQKSPQVAKHNESPLRCLALSPTGSTLVTGSGEVGPRGQQLLQFWDAKTLERRGDLLVTDSPISAVAYASEPTWKRLLTGENDGTIRLWDLSLPEPFVEWEQKKVHAGQGCTAVGFLPSGKRFLSAGADGVLILRQGDEGKEVQRWAASTQPLRALALLPTGDILTGGDDGTLRVWRVGEAKPIREQASGSAVLALAAAKSGDILSGHADGTLRLWSADLVPHPETIVAHPEGVRSVAWFAEPGRAVTGGADGSVRLWELPCFPE